MKLTPEQTTAILGKKRFEPIHLHWMPEIDKHDEPARRTRRPQKLEYWYDI